MLLPFFDWSSARRNSMAGGYINLIKGWFRMVPQIQTLLLPILYRTPLSLFLSLPILDTSQCQTHLAFVYQWQTWQAQIQKGFVKLCFFINIYLLWGWMMITGRYFSLCRTHKNTHHTHCNTSSCSFYIIQTAHLLNCNFALHFLRWI